MRALRIATRLLLFTLATALSYLALLAVRFAAWLTRGSSALACARIQRVWSKVTAAIIGLTIESSGTPPERPFFLVSNHLSYVDIVVLASHLECVFVARGDVADWPLFGTLCRGANVLFVDRALKRDIPRVIEKMEEAMGRGTGVIVFPEGTSSAGARVLEFKPSLLESAARANLPVWYASLSYRTPPGADPAHEAVCWSGDAPFGGHLIRLFGLPGMTATLEFGPEPIVESDRKVLATRLHQAVVGSFRPVVH